MVITIILSFSNRSTLTIAKFFFFSNILVNYTHLLHFFFLFFLFFLNFFICKFFYKFFTYFWIFLHLFFPIQIACILFFPQNLSKTITWSLQSSSIFSFLILIFIINIWWVNNNFIEVILLLISELLYFLFSFLNLFLLLFLNCLSFIKLIKFCLHFFLLKFLFVFTYNFSPLFIRNIQSSWRIFIKYFCSWYYIFFYFNCFWSLIKTTICIMKTLCFAIVSFNIVIHIFINLLRIIKFLRVILILKRARHSIRSLSL